MGVTGAGKSHFIREVTGNSGVEVSSDLYSCTNKVQSYSFGYAGARITLVDTPGFNSMNRSDTEVLQEIAEWTSATYRNEQLLSGIIYLHPITHTRIEGSVLKSLKMFQRLCGQEALENVFLTTTQWSRANWAEGEFRENRLRNSEFWGGLTKEGATLQRFAGTRESGLELIHRLMSNKPKPLRIQNQIVEQHMTLLETDAGKCINEALAAQAQEKKYKEELESLVRERQEAMKAKDEMKEILAVERAKAREKLEEVVAERCLLEGLYAEEAEKRPTEEKKRQEEIGERKKVVIVVDTESIAIPNDTTSGFASYSTGGRLVSGINDHEVSKSNAFEIEVYFQRTPTSVLRTSEGTVREMFDTGVVGTNHIILDGIYYRCESETPTEIGSQEFFIFSKG
ncbi:hypothetical protein B9Z19DRAFT_1033627 [Tuber borchii]|uniref:G domain-containing protein n=1 Tax=Tuber borchii TaxID=42251 RepID=A0A2T6ZFB1_TUBBO|nr:hypothetical protein B9Z19DRAFT_1033627 [Tuber borchii]